MHASVTGASGFIGRRLVTKLLSAGATVTVLTRGESLAEFEGRVRFVRADLCHPEDDLRPLIEGCDTLFSCAGELYRPERMAALHVGGTRRLLAVAEADASNRATPLHWVNLSSVGAYGPPRGRPSDARVVTEEYPPAPVGEYEITKTRADELVIEASLRQLITCTIVRPSNVFGETMTNASLRGLLSMIRKGLFFYVGSADAMANYVHVDDVVDALIRCGEHPAARNRIFNISNDCRLIELVTASAKELGVAPPRLRIPERGARLLASLGAGIPGFPLTQERINALVGQTHYSSEQIQRELGVRPAISVASRACAMLGLPTTQAAR
jgi:nucleoside-diphosphate-sugar epimerase